MEPIYKLVSTNLTNVGGRMGTETTSTNFRLYFTTKNKAKKRAEKDYGKKIRWFKDGEAITSGDLLHVEYDISEIKIEE